MKNFKTIGVLTSGGDAPGMNAAVRAVTRAALAKGLRVLGIMRGYSGLIDHDVEELHARSVGNIIDRGGTILYTARCKEMMTAEGFQRAVNACRELGIDGIVAIGGDGTFRGAKKLTEAGVPCICLPGTIDNDVASTDHTIGFDTAMNTIIALIDNLRDTCESHARCSVIEVMGRGSGDIALNTGIGSGATGIAIPEIPFDEDALIEKIKHSRELGKRNFLVIVSEAFGGDFGERLTKRIEEETGVESRFARLGHIVRGGSPSLHDRVLASQMGYLAVEELLKGHSNLVICERRNKIVSRDIQYALTLDAMYKGHLEEGELDRFDEATVRRMQSHCERKRKIIRRLYDMANDINI